MQAGDGQLVNWLQGYKMLFSALDEILAVSLDNGFKNSMDNNDMQRSVKIFKSSSESAQSNLKS